MLNERSSLGDDLNDIGERCLELRDYWTDRPITREEAFKRVKVISRIGAIRELLTVMEDNSIPPHKKRSDWPF